MFKWHTRFKQGQKSIQDGPRSGGRKIISGKLDMHSLGSFPNTTRLGTRPLSKDGMIISRSVSEKMDNILNQRTNGPVNAHLISLPSKAQNIQNLENIW